MEKLTRFAGSAVVMLALSVPAVGQQVATLSADLDGDTKPELVILSVSGPLDDFQNFTVSVGGAKYTGRFFAVDADVPEMRLVRIDYARNLRQILVTTFGASSCEYHLLAYQQTRLSLLTKSESEGCDEVPRPLGNGEVELGTWMGFWTKNERYVLDSTGTKLTRKAADIYPVNVRVQAAREVTLAAATCTQRTIHPGMYVFVESYEPAQHRYFLRAAQGVCGWLADGAINDDLDQIPYAK